jgi:signal transduction histidine kinase
MSSPGKQKHKKNFLYALLRFFSFFLLMCFIITCCMLLFLKELESAMGVSLQQADIQKAAILTFLNIILLSFICAIVDAIRRHFMVERPLKRIIASSERVMQGDLTTHIKKEKSIDPQSSFNIIIDYFNRMTKELSGMETLRTDFISNVSHELKTPLSVMQNYGTMLQQPDLPEEKRIEYAKVITDSSRSLANMVSNILRLNKLENQTIYPDARVYDLGEQLSECLVGFEDIWDKKGIEIDVDVEENVLVRADPDMLTLVWNNLFSNAMKFTDTGGKVSLRMKSEGNLAIVQVSDTGCGISPEVGKHMFEKFYQGDTSHATKGNGLGLALVKRVMDITGGDISVSSVVGKGSTFTVKLGRESHGAHETDP